LIERVYYENVVAHKTRKCGLGAVPRWGSLIARTISFIPAIPFICLQKEKLTAARPLRA
jgi:hypothetical protein